MLPITNMGSSFIQNDTLIIQKGSNASVYNPLTNVYIPLNVTESNSALSVGGNIIVALNNNISQPSSSIYPNNIVSVSEYSSLSNRGLNCCTTSIGSSRSVDIKISGPGSNIDSDVNTRGLNCYTPSVGGSSSAGIEVKILESNIPLAYESESDELDYIAPLPKGCTPTPIESEENIKPYCLDTLGNNPKHGNTI